MTLALGFFARYRLTLSPIGVAIRPPQSTQDLSRMREGTARQPFVRRQLVPFLMRVANHFTSSELQAELNDKVAPSPALRPFLVDTSPGEALDSLVCLIVWCGCFAVFAFTLESEATYYASQTMQSSDQVHRQLLALTVLSCALVLLLLHTFNYAYDPPTLALSALVMRALRRERLVQLCLLTGLFSVNRETAFIVPGLTFFYWIHRHRIGSAVRQAAILSAVCFIIEGTIAFHFRHNPGSFAENHVPVLIHTYLHERVLYAIAAAATLVFYGVQVMRHWSDLPPALKAVQWFVPPWIAMHVLWGWPMEWRVFLEIYPGMVLTAVAVWTASKYASVARHTDRRLSIEA
jgi:hypothetical protein